LNLGEFWLTETTVQYCVSMVFKLVEFYVLRWCWHSRGIRCICDAVSLSVSSVDTGSSYTAEEPRDALW